MGFGVYMEKGFWVLILEINMLDSLIKIMVIKMRSLNP
jgi:hypothetical protein